MEEKKTPHPVDVHVGSRVKVRRTMIGMSQEKLGEALGLTFQQVQKYEKGTNRIGASRLFQIAKTLDVPISFLFEGVGGTSRSQGFSESGQSGFEPKDTPETAFVQFVSSNEGIELCRHFSCIDDTRVRRRIIDLIKVLASQEAK
ncbi:MAG: helix-turn-helix transcriptional regulator [Pseudomonadota bacterium]